MATLRLVARAVFAAYVLVGVMSAMAGGFCLLLFSLFGENLVTIVFAGGSVLLSPVLLCLAAGFWVGQSLQKSSIAPDDLFVLSLKIALGLCCPLAFFSARWWRRPLPGGWHLLSACQFWLSRFHAG